MIEDTEGESDQCGPLMKFKGFDRSSQIEVIAEDVDAQITDIVSKSKEKGGSTLGGVDVGIYRFIFDSHCRFKSEVEKNSLGRAAVNPRRFSKTTTVPSKGRSPSQ